MEKDSIILKLYEEYMDEIHEADEENVKITTEFVEQTEKFEEQLSKEQVRQLEDIIDKALNMNQNTIKQAFVGGYRIGTQLTTEALYGIRRNNLFKRLFLFFK
ncbi:MAG: hypothetical protein IJH39_01885 [Clostridia bacterium]|nr:hypothetical protein [Clostridia bacterium]